MVVGYPLIRGSRSAGRKGGLRSLGIGGSDGNKGRLTEIGTGLIIEFGFLSLK